MEALDWTFRLPERCRVIGRERRLPALAGFTMPVGECAGCLSRFSVLVLLAR